MFLLDNDKKLYKISINADDSCDIKYSLTEKEYQLIKDICDELYYANTNYCGSINIELISDGK